jgi:hypothetical protein
MNDENQRKSIVEVLKQYKGITGRMDLSINSPLVIDLAKAKESRDQQIALAAQIRELEQMGEVGFDDVPVDIIKWRYERLEELKSKKKGL